MIKYLISVMLMLLFAQQTPTDKPLIFPVAADPGPSTWLLGQPYGNTVGAYNFGTAWYSSGQGLHFGIDVSMPCGTPLVAVADGQVAAVDNLNFGSGPHNLIIRHEALGIASLYGHLLRAPALTPGQQVTQGQVIAESGDPDVTCDSRPHLHYEVRSLDYWTTYNPVDYIDVNWHNLAITGGYNSTLFQGDMDNPRRWMTLEDQPPVRFGGARLNAYQSVFPLGQNERPASNALLPRELPPLTEDVKWTARPVGFDQCCWIKWWNPTDPDIFYTIDGANGQRAAIFEWSDDEMQSVVATAPPTYKSPDGTHEISRENGNVYVRDIAADRRFIIESQGETPSISTDNSRLMWVVTAQVAVPGSPRPLSTVWVSDLDGENARQLFSEPGVSASWLDDSRLLISKAGEHRLTTLIVYDTADDTQFELGSWTWMRNMTVSPSGSRIMFYITNQPEGAGIYTMETQPDAEAQKIDWFGGWRWRDADSVYYIPLDIHADYQTLHYYHIPTGEDLALTDGTLPFTVMNGDWDVSADGQRILFHNDADHELWILEHE